MSGLSLATKGFIGAGKTEVLDVHKLPLELKIEKKKLKVAVKPFKLTVTVCKS